MGLLIESILDDEKITDTTVGSVCVRIRDGALSDTDFRRLLVVLESTPFNDDAQKICDELFDFVKNNLLHAQKEEEIIALGCAIRKLIFNLEDGELDKTANLLDDLSNDRKQSQSTRVEKMICKALADRFEAYPMLYTETVSKRIADRLVSTVRELLFEYSWNDETTNATLGQAILGFLCYASKQNPFRNQLKDMLHNESVPAWFRGFYRNYSIPFQENIDKKWNVLCNGDPEALKTKPDIKGFFEV